MTNPNSHSSFLTHLFLINLLAVLTGTGTGTGTAMASDWNVGNRSIPAPEGASSELQKVIAETPAPESGAIPNKVELTADQIRAMVLKHTEALIEKNPALIKKRNVDVRHSTMGGVSVYHIAPDKISAENTDRLFIFTHGGAYVYGPGEAGLDEPMLLAARLGIKVLSIDYRMPPDHPYPAAVSDVVAVYKELLKRRSPKSLIFGGSSAGGGLLLSSIHKFKELGLPLPAALFAGTPWADLSDVGDSIAINDGIDQILLSYSLLEPAAKSYANGLNLKDKRISPVYGDFESFPPTIIASGTRDLFLSHAIRVHRKLRAAGVVAELHVYEGMSHATYMKYPDIPESIDLFKEIQQFVSKHVD